MIKKISFTLLTIILILLALVSSLVGFIFYSEKAVDVLSQLLQYHNGTPHYTHKTSIGSLASGLSIQDIKFSGFSQVPTDTVFEIQKVKILLNPLKLFSSYFIIENGRIKFQDNDPILLYGDWKPGRIDFSWFTPRLFLSDLSLFIPSTHFTRNLTAAISKLDIKISGSLLALALKGTFFVDKFENKNFSYHEAEGSLTSTQSPIFKFRKTQYLLHLEGGIFRAKKSAPIHILSADIHFKKALNNPHLNIAGYSTISDVRIDIRVVGTFEDPIISLNSNTNLSDHTLLTMLITGKRWQGLETSLEDGRISPSLAFDFIDYLVLGGSGAGMIQKLGISSVSINYTDEKKSVGLKKNITDRISVGYKFGDERSPEEQRVLSQRVSGEVKLTDKFSIEGEKEFLQESPTIENQEATRKTDDRVMLKFKTEF